MTRQHDRAVSPVVAVILMVAVTVVLSAVVGMFVFNLGQNATNSDAQDIGVRTTVDGSTLTVQVITGDADEVQLRVNGTVADSATDASPGTSLSASVTPDSDVTVLSVTDGERRVISNTNPLANGEATVSDTIAGPTDGLIAYYEADAGSGSVAYDTAESNDGQITDASWTSAAQVGSHALFFSGSSGSVEAPHQDYLNRSTFSVSVWVNFDDLATGSWQGIVSKGTGSSPDRNYALFQNKNSKQVHFSFWRTDSSWASYNSNSNLSANTWHHVVATYDGSKFKLYLDGSLDASYSETGTPTTTDESLYIGGFPDYTTMNGTADDVRVYNRSLSGSEVQDLYDATK